jgi:3-oxoacyl-[acyl-carrier-protein] synthase II
MRDVFVSGVAVVDAAADPRQARWRTKPPRLARMDRACTLALLAAEAALADAGAAPDWDGARVGVVVGTAFGCHATNEEYYRGALDPARGASPRLFAYTLPSSPLGEVSIHLGARGPAEAVVSGGHAGVEAVARAGRLCAAGRADLVVAIAVEVGGGTLPG